MMIRKRTEVFLQIELTEAQATNLLRLLDTGKTGHVNELSIQAQYGDAVAEEVNETIRDLREALEDAKA